MDPRYSLKSQRLISDPEELPWELTPREAAYFAAAEKERSPRLPFLVSTHYLSLASDLPDDPIRRQILPQIGELWRIPAELSDPLGEDLHSPGSRMVHTYASRLLILLNDNCATYCRHCFRRRFTGQDMGSLQNGQLRGISNYLREHGEIKEILLSGGDALMLSTERLGEVLQSLREVRGDVVIRIASRLPVVLPQRFDEKLLAVLKTYQPLWLITHFNHKQEINEVTRYYLSQIIESGIPVLNQSVLLAGINDRVEILQDLMEELVRLRVKPYYLFQGDMAEGTAHFRVTLERGWEIVRELRKRLSGIAMPQYAVDLPGGGGKIPLTETYLRGETESAWLFESLEGQIYSYPKEHLNQT